MSIQVISLLPLGFFREWLVCIFIYFAEIDDLFLAWVVLDGCIDDLAVEEPERIDHVRNHNHLHVVLLRYSILLQRHTRPLDEPVDDLGRTHLLSHLGKIVKNGLLESCGECSPLTELADGSQGLQMDLYFLG